MVRPPESTNQACASIVQSPGAAAAAYTQSCASPPSYSSALGLGSGWTTPGLTSADLASLSGGAGTHPSALGVYTTPGLASVDLASSSVGLDADLNGAGLRHCSTSILPRHGSPGVSANVEDGVLAWLTSIPPEQREQLVRAATVGVPGPAVDSSSSDTPLPVLPADDLTASRQPLSVSGSCMKFPGDWWPKHSSVDAAMAVATIRLCFIVIVNALAASSLLAALVLYPPRLFAAGLAFVLGWLGCYALMTELECRRLRGSPAQKSCNGASSDDPTWRALVRPVDSSADLDLSGYADVHGLVLPEATGTTPTADAVYSTALVSEYLRCTATLKKYQAKYGPLPRKFDYRTDLADTLKAELQPK